MLAPPHPGRAKAPSVLADTIHSIISALVTCKSQSGFYSPHFAIKIGRNMYMTKNSGFDLTCIDWIDTFEEQIGFEIKI